MLEGGIPAADRGPTVSLVFIDWFEGVTRAFIAPCQFSGGAKQDILLAPELLQRCNPFATPPTTLHIHAHAVAEVALILVCVILPDQPPLLEVVDTHRLQTFLLGLGQGRQQHGRQNGNDGDHHQQLDQRERPDRPKHASCLFHKSSGWKIWPKTTRQTRLF